MAFDNPGSVIRLWLPLGQTLMLVAILETVDIVRNELNDIGKFIYRSLQPDSVDYSEYYSLFELIFLTICISIRLISTIGLLWIGTVIYGSKRALFAWLVITSVSLVALLIFFQVLIVNSPHSIDAKHAGSIAYSFVIFLTFNAYALYITWVSYKAMCRQELLRPIGNGLTFIWEYFSNESKIGATFFLTSEIVVDSEYLLSKQFMQFFGIYLQGHDGDPYLPIVVEEIVLRVIRIVVNAIGIWLVVTEKRRLFRWWCAFTFFLILASTAIFVILTVQWRGEDISDTLAYFLMFPGHLLYRFATLYFCLKFTRADFSRFVL